jgi:uncharacterized membrane protein HdeD (DUF308 family)
MRFLFAMLLLSGLFITRTHASVCSLPARLNLQSQASFQQDSLPAKREMDPASLTAGIAAGTSLVVLLIATAILSAGFTIYIISFLIGLVALVAGIIGIRHRIKSKIKKRGLGLAVLGTIFGGLYTLIVVLSAILIAAFIASSH